MARGSLSARVTLIFLLILINISASSFNEEQVLPQNQTVRQRRNLFINKVINEA